MNLTENAKTVLEKRYLIKDANGAPLETVDGLFSRVADAVAAADLLYDEKADVQRTSGEFLNLMTNLDFLPNSPTLMNAGRPLGQLSACFVLPVEDSMEEIFGTVKNAALIHKSGGGTGFSFSRLRPKGSPVNSTGGVASGPVSFMKVFNAATEAVKQGGTRRGANMGILRVDHPDILEFIDCKKDTREITNFNISVGITEKFMNAALSNGEYELVDPSTKKVTGCLNASEVFQKIVDAAWRTGEPGIIFLDRLNADNKVPQMGEIESTNPCGEQPLLPYESCNLGSVNLLNMLKSKKSGWEIDYQKLSSTVRTAVHFLDNVIDVNRYPLDEIAATTKKSRKIGLGVMGWADMLLKLNLSYASEEALALAESLMGFIDDEAKKASEALAAKRGTFPAYEGSVWEKEGKRLRHATLTTIAPTGTLSIIAGVSSGVEPIFAYAFIRNVMDGVEMLEVNPILKKTLEQRGLFSDSLLKKIAAEGTLSHIPEIPEDLKKTFVSAHDISPLYHIKMQSAFQRHTDNAVSKTVNFPAGATREDVEAVYKIAFETGCKGVTVYRDGSREMQVLNIGKVNDSKAAAPEKKAAVTPRPRPDITTGFTEKVKIGCGNLYVTVNYDENGICEVFTNTGRAGGCPSQSEATSRLVSIALRSGLDVASIVEQLRGIRCLSTIRKNDVSVTSCPDAIAKVIAKVAKLQNGDAKAPSDIFPVYDSPAPLSLGPQGGRLSDAEIKNQKACPECGADLEHEGGCVSCRGCGYSKCG